MAQRQDQQGQGKKRRVAERGAQGVQEDVAQTAGEEERRRQGREAKGESARRSKEARATS